MIGKMKLIKMLNLFQPIEFSLSKFDSLDPKNGKAVGKREKFHQPGIFSYSLKHDVNLCKLTCFLKKTSSFHAKMKIILPVEEKAFVLTYFTMQNTFFFLKKKRSKSTRQTHFLQMSQNSFI